MLSKLTAALTHNVATKLLALLLALVVYAHVVTEREQESELKVPLRVTGLSAALVLTDPPPSHALLTARGKGKQMFKLRVEPPALVVDLTGVRPGKVQRILSPGDVFLPVGTSVTVSEILEPRMVELEVDTVIVKEVAIEVLPDGKLPPGIAITRAVATDPLRVEVKGPSLVLRRMTRVQARFDPGRLHDVSVPGDRGTVVLTVPIRVSGGQTVVPQEIQARIEFVRTPPSHP